MRNIYKKILIILPMLVFIGMMSYAKPAHATGILGSVEQWVSEKWDAATTVGKAAFDALKNGANPAAIMEAVGSTAAAALGLLPAHDCPSPILEKNERPCMFCQMFRIIYMASAGIARTTYNFFHSDIGKLILIFTAIALALIILKNVAVMGARDPGNIANELFTKGFICIAIYLIITEDYFNVLNLTINSVLKDGLQFATAVSSYDSDYTINLGGSHLFMGSEHDAAFSKDIGDLILHGVHHIEKKINVLFQYGNFAWCLGTGPERIFKILPNPVFLIDGLLLYIGGLLFLIGYPWVLADALIQMGIAMALLPFTLAGYAFSGTKNYLNKTFQWILHAMFVFIFMGILILCVLEYVGGIIENLFTNQYEAHDFFTNPLTGIAFYGINMLKIMFVLFLGWVYMPLTRDLASKFAQGSSLTAAATTGKAVTNAVEQNMQRVGSWAGNATVRATKSAAVSLSHKTGRGIMTRATSWFGHDDGSGNKTLTIGTRLMPKLFTGGMEFKVIKDVDGNKILRREFTSVTGRKHVMLSDKYTTIKEEYTASGKLVRRQAVFKKDFAKNHLFDKKGRANVDALKALLNTPMGKNPAYRQAIMEQVATEALKNKNKELGKYFKSRTVTFDPSNPYHIHIIQTDHNDRETHVTLDINENTGQSALSYTSKFKHREFSVRKKSEVDFYFDNGVVEIQSSARRKADGSLREEVTKFRYSQDAQKGHDSILVDGSNPIVDPNTGAIAGDLQSMRGGRPNPLDLTYGMNDILGGTYAGGRSVSDFLVQEVLQEGAKRHTNKFVTNNILQYFI